MIIRQIDDSCVLFDNTNSHNDRYFFIEFGDKEIGKSGSPQPRRKNYIWNEILLNLHTEIGGT